LVTDSNQLSDLFRRVAADLQLNYAGRADIASLVALATTLSTRPPERSLANFEHHLDTSEWDRIQIDGKLAWICTEDVLFQIVIDYSDEEFEDREAYSEDWVDQFPSIHPARVYPVKLTIAGLPIKKSYFISLDQGRYFVPQPEMNNGAAFIPQRFIWRRNSLSFKVAQIISVDYFDELYPDFESIAADCGIAVLD
jgi:hypothetical protein